MLRIIKFGERLKKNRELNKLTQRELANIVGVSFSTYRRWEVYGTMPRAGELSKLARALNISEEDLLNEQPADTWTLEIKISNKEVIDMTQCGSISNLDLQKNYAALTLGGSYEMFEDDGKFEDFINQLRAARPVVIETGRKLRGIL